MEKGFLPKIYGGLGNQIFIVVSSWILSNHHSCPLYIPKQPSSKNKHSSLNYYTNILSEFGIHLPFTEEECISKLPWAIEWRKGFAPWSPEDFRPGQILDSYFQYYPPLAPFESEIRSRLLQGLQKSVPVAPKPWAFMHIRRGDYLKAANFHFLQPIEYYVKGYELLLSKSTGKPEKILIFSDDEEWILSQPFFQQEGFECVRGKNEIESLALMASCTSGAICANSTFSWWGAFLGAYESRSPVIVPNRWIGERVYSLFPEEWIMI